MFVDRYMPARCAIMRRMVLRCDNSYCGWGGDIPRSSVSPLAEPPIGIMKATKAMPKLWQSFVIDLDIFWLKRFGTPFRKNFEITFAEIQHELKLHSDKAWKKSSAAIKICYQRKWGFLIVLSTWYQISKALDESYEFPILNQCHNLENAWTTIY